jgi:hypothetical protein
MQMSRGMLSRQEIASIGTLLETCLAGPSHTKQSRQKGTGPVWSSRSLLF